MFGSSSWRLDSVQHQIAGLIVAVENAIAADVDVAREINCRGDSGLNDDLTRAADRNVTSDINFDVILAAVRIAGNRECFAS